MKNQIFPKELIELAQRVGQFIQYWGFKELHGQIWCLVYLSQKPLSGQDLADALGVSKASISIAIQELVFYEVIIPSQRGIRNTVYYESNHNISEVICHVLKNRELLLVQNSFAALQGVKAVKNQNIPLINETHLEQLEDMIKKAQVFLHLLISSHCDPQGWLSQASFEQEQEQELNQGQDNKQDQEQDQTKKGNS